MSLRTKLLGIFALFGLVPLLALNAFNYARAVGVVRRFVVDQTAPFAARVAARATDELTVVRGDLELIAGSDEAANLVRAGTGTPVVIASPAAHAYLDDAWRTFGDRFDWIELQDGTGRGVARWGARLSDDSLAHRSRQPVTVLRLPAGANGTVLGAARLDRLVPPSYLQPHLGRGGYTIIADLQHRGSPSLAHGRASRPDAVAAVAAVAAADGGEGAELWSASYTERDSARIASVARIPGSSLIVISAGTPGEFAGSFASMGATNLVFGLALTAALAIGFVVVTRRVTLPLEQLTRAATTIGGGDFSPHLPQSG